MKNALYVILVIASSHLCAQDAKDTAGPPEYKYSVCLQVGQPNKLAGAESFSEIDVFNPLHGEYHRLSIGAGAGFRCYLDETFFLHARVMYSIRKTELYDSTISTQYDNVNGNVQEHHIISYAMLSKFRMSNLLIGIGGGHEGHYGKFSVRAGGEIDYIQYIEVMSYDVSGTYDDMTQDSLANAGTYQSLELRGWIDKTIMPNVWGIGIVGHASLEYRATTALGIGATIYMGGFYTGANNATWKQEAGSHNTFSDSNGANYTDDSITTTHLDYTARQFDFSPLNGQINVVYYFGK